MPIDLTWRDRVIAEHDDLRVKVERLTAALQSPKVVLPSRQRDLLRVQHCVMQTYLAILKQRLEDE